MLTFTAKVTAINDSKSVAARHAIRDWFVLMNIAKSLDSQMLNSMFHWIRRIKLNMTLLCENIFLYSYRFINLMKRQLTNIIFTLVSIFAYIFF